MATPPLTRRTTALNERLRLLDDAFIPTLTPTNTWLNNVQQSDEGDGDSPDDITPTEEDHGPGSRRNRFEEPPKATRSTSQSGRKTSLSSTSSEPRSSSLPPAIPPKAATSPLPKTPNSPENNKERSPSDRSGTATRVLERQGTVPIEQLLRTYSNLSELDTFTSPSRAYSTEDGLFSTSPWATDDGSQIGEFFRVQDLRLALETRLQEASSSSGSARRSEKPKSVKSESSPSDSVKDLDDDDDRDEATLDLNDAYVEGVDIDLPLRSPSFQMRVFDPGSTDYESSNEYSAETIENIAQEWSGQVQELPSISEEESAAVNTMDFAPADLKRRSSDTGVHFPVLPKGYSMRRVSTMTDYQRLKGRHKSPKLVAFKASPAGPAVTAMSVQPAEAWRVATIYEAANLAQEVENASRRTSQSIRTDLGISQMVWEEPSSSSDSDITVLTGSGVDYLVTDEVENDVASSSPMERLKTKLKAWSWEREMSEALSDRPRYIPLLDTEERSHRRQSSDLIENPPGPPNTVRHSGQSSAFSSDPQTPTDTDNYEEEEDEPVIELKAKSLPRPIPIPASNSSAASSGDYLEVPRRTSSLPASPSIFDSEESGFPHRDSVDISHARLDWDEIKDKRNQELIVNSRDSFLITKSRLQAKHPKANKSVMPTGGAITWSRFGGLSPIADASPPNFTSLEERKDKQKADAVGLPARHDVAHEVNKGKQKIVGVAKKKVEVVETPSDDPEEHDDCPICEVHRPRWFEAKHRDW